jgi:hypothetical protein
LEDKERAGHWRIKKSGALEHKKRVGNWRIKKEWSFGG